jgi:type II secretory pathway pseudopilin PulG
MRSTRTTRRRRAGISLIEVMFAIGVVAIGLLGVIAVLPLALSQIGRGQVADTASRVAMSSVEEFHTRGMTRPDFWLAWNPAANQWLQQQQFQTGFGNTPGLVLSQSLYKQAFCIDPQFVAANCFVTTGNNRAHTFPYPNAPPQPNANTHTDPRMMRISLRSIVDTTTPFNAQRRSAAVAAAENVFVSHDDLVLDIPADDSLPPEQLFSSLAGTPAFRSRRDFEGLFSWMATITPKIDGAGFQKDLYNVSVLVFHHRDPRFAMFQDDNANNVQDAGELPTDNEAVVEVGTATANPAYSNGFPGGGYRGGDVLLSMPSSMSPEVLSLKDGDWLMLKGWFRSSTSAPMSSDVPLFRWYRVVNADTAPELVNNGATYILNVTLDGPDWPSTNMVNVAIGSPTKAVIVRNVVAVYDRTIRLERTTLF